MLNILPKLRRYSKSRAIYKQRLNGNFDNIIPIYPITPRRVLLQLLNSYYNTGYNWKLSNQK